MLINKSFLEDLKLFYDKYLNIGLNSIYLESLVEKYLKIWNSKDKTNGISNINFLSFSESDYNKFSPLDQEFLNFIHCSCITINDKYDIIIDSYGNICRFIFKKALDLSEKQELCSNLHQNIFSFLRKLPNDYEYQEAYNEVENIILQNILASKIFKAIYEKIAIENNIIEASLFALANALIFSYEDNLNELLNYEELFKDKLANSRSRR